MAASSDEQTYYVHSSFKKPQEKVEKDTDDLLPGICRECSEYLCFKHQKKVHIHRTQLSLNSSQSSSQDDVEQCKAHNEKIKFYCAVHEVVGCGECMITKHESCRPLYIKDIAKDYKDDNNLEAITERIGHLDKELNSNKDSVQANKKKNRKMVDDVVDKIKEFRSELNVYLDKVESEVLNEVKQYGLENQNTLSTLEKEIQEADLDLEDIKHSINAEIHSNCALFINRMNAKRKLADVEKVIYNVNTKNVIDTLKFSRDKDISKICDPRRKLGIVSKDRPGTERNSVAWSHQLDKSFSEVASFNSLTLDRPRTTRRGKTFGGFRRVKAHRWQKKWKRSFMKK